jgi:hypothetical protein
VQIARNTSNNIFNLGILINRGGILSPPLFSTIHKETGYNGVKTPPVVAV